MRAPLGCLRCHRPFRARPRPTCPRTPCPESRARFGAERTRRPSRAARACLCRPGGRTGRPPAMPLGAYSRPVSRYCSERPRAARARVRMRWLLCIFWRRWTDTSSNAPRLPWQVTGPMRRDWTNSRELVTPRCFARFRGSICAAECHSRFGSALRERRGKRSTRLPSRPNAEKVI